MPQSPVQISYNRRLLLPGFCHVVCLFYRPAHVKETTRQCFTVRRLFLLPPYGSSLFLHYSARAGAGLYLPCACSSIPPGWISLHRSAFHSRKSSDLRTLVFQAAAILFLPLLLGIDGIWFSILIAELMAVIFGVIFLFAKQKKYNYWKSDCMNPIKADWHCKAVELIPVPGRKHMHICHQKILLQPFRKSSSIFMKSSK